MSGVGNNGGGVGEMEEGPNEMVGEKSLSLNMIRKSFNLEKKGGLEIV